MGKQKKLEAKIWKKFEKQGEKKSKEELRETNKRIETLEAAKKAVEQKAAKAERDGALDRALSNIPWESEGSRDLARSLYMPLVKLDDDTGEFMIHGVSVDAFIKSEIPDKYPNLLAKNKPVSAAQKETVKTAPTKPASIDFDLLTAATGKADLDAACRRVSELLAEQN